ncbi:hypothetical protein F4776DRAFT_597580 [Hypoxylon sp. NC0597]|nr:hypothetical protein F4776DRAFT_597580 [Hypoxylon sp. NC0597]
MPRKQAAPGPYRPNQKYMDHLMARVTSADSPSRPNISNLNDSAGHAKTGSSTHHTAHNSMKRTENTRGHHRLGSSQSTSCGREELPIDDNGSESESGDDTLNNGYVKGSVANHTGRSAAKSNLSKLMETANDPKYAHLFSHLRRPSPIPRPRETTTVQPTRPTPKNPTKSHPILRRGVNYFIIDDSDSDADERPRKRFGKHFNPEDSDDNYAGSDEDHEAPEKIKKRRLV